MHFLLYNLLKCQNKKCRNSSGYPLILADDCEIIHQSAEFNPYFTRNLLTKIDYSVLYSVADQVFFKFLLTLISLNYSIQTKI